MRTFGALMDRYWAKNTKPEEYRDTELLPTSLVWTFREFDRRDHGAHSRANIDDLKEHIKKHGILVPLILDYNQDDRTVRLAEGHHRLVAAMELGLPDVPVHVMRKSYPFNMGRGGSALRAPVKVPGIDPDETDYVPGNMAPSDIGLPGRKP